MDFNEQDWHPEREGHRVRCRFLGLPHGPSFRKSQRGGPKTYIFSNSLPSLVGVGQRLHLEMTLRSDKGWLGCVPVWLWSGLSTVQNPPALVQRGLQKIHPPLRPWWITPHKGHGEFCLLPCFPQPSCTPSTTLTHSQSLPPTEC